jgi:hypothetical protein
VSISTLAQKGAKTRTDTYNVNYKYPPILNSFTQITRYRVNYPKALTYHQGMECDNIFSGNYQNNLKGKNIPAPNDVEYEINVICPGISNLEIRNVRQTPEPYVTGQPDLKGWQGDVTCVFPCVFEIYVHRNDSVVLLKQIKYFDYSYVHKIAFTKKVCEPSIADGQSYLFTSDFETNNYFKNPGIKKILEYQIARQVYGGVTDILHQLFAYREILKEYSYYAYIRPKGRSFDYSDIDSLTELYKTALKLNNEDNYSGCDSLIKIVTNGFIKLKNSSDERIDRNVKEILDYNLAWCMFWQGNFEETNKYIAAFAAYDHLVYGNYNALITPITYRIGIRNMREKLAKGIYSVINK